MRGRSSTALRALAITPGLVVSTVLTCMVGALIPPWAGWLLLVGGLALMAVLCAGRLEGVGVKLLAQGRPLSAAEAAAVAPAVTLLCQRGIGPPLITLYVRPGHVAIAASAVGRRSIVLSSGLVEIAYLGQLPADQAAAVIAHPVGQARRGHTKYDVAVAFWTLPWQLVLGISMAVARSVSWLPLVSFAWKVRFIVATVAVVQSVSDGRPAAGVVIAVFIGLTYLTPRWHRASQRHRQDDADRFVVEHDLGEPLVRFLKRCPNTPDIHERIHRLTGPTQRPALTLVATATTRQT